MLTLLGRNKKSFELVRHYAKVAVGLDTVVLNKLEQGEIKPTKHPGTQKYGEILVPQHIIKSIVKCTGNNSVKQLLNDGYKLSRCIAARHPPPEQSFIQYKVAKIEAQLNEKYPPLKGIENMNEAEIEQYNNKRKNKMHKMLKDSVYSWKPINFGKYESLVYAVGRGSLEYTILSKILREINEVDSNFKPRSFFDFGSGVGTGMWAASNLWKNTIFEYYNVDSSREMNDLADLILREGNDNQKMILKNVYFRQFLPAKDTQFDLIISSFSLFELNSQKSRFDVLLNLWSKCANYLVIVEEGSRSGFNLVSEARDFLLKQGAENSELTGHIFSPCPHHLTCPRLANEADKTPCNFEIQYEPFSIEGKRNRKSTHLYSYVVLKKGHKPNNENDCVSWPRIVRPTLVRARHTVCRLCTAHGNLQEIIFTASKHGKLTYQCARSSKWGDKLPIHIEKENEINTEIDKT